MKRLILGALLLVPAAAIAASAWDGTWKLKPESMRFEGKPDVFDVTNGVYNCSNCIPQYSVKADGTPQPVPGHAYLDHQSVKIVTPTAIELTNVLAGKTMLKLTQTVSADGKKLTGQGVDYSGAKPVDYSFTEKRVAPGPAGAHAVSGSWMQDSLGTVSPEGLLVVLSSTANGIKLSFNGQSADVKFDGKDYPIVGDPGKTTMTMKQTGDHVLEETDHRLGKSTDITTWTLSADGKTITQVDKDQLHATTTTSVFEKQ
jgi:hypothetical protein